MKWRGKETYQCLARYFQDISRTRNVVDTGFIECYYVTNLIIYFAYIIVEARYSKVV